MKRVRYIGTAIPGATGRTALARGAPGEGFVQLQFDDLGLGPHLSHNWITAAVYDVEVLPGWAGEAP